MYSLNVKETDFFSLDTKLPNIVAVVVFKQALVFQNLYLCKLNVMISNLLSG